MKRLAALALLVGTLGCSGDSKSICWRTDTAPIVKRLPALASCTNMHWHCEILTKSSFLSVPGPSAYRIACYVPQANVVLSSQFAENPKFYPAENCDLISEAEIQKIQNIYSIDVTTNDMVMSDELSEMLIKPPYWGECAYFKDNNLLVIILCGE